MTDAPRRISALGLLFRGLQHAEADQTTANIRGRNQTKTDSLGVGMFMCCNVTSTGLPFAAGGDMSTAVFALSALGILLLQGVTLTAIVYVGARLAIRHERAANGTRF